MKFGQASLLIGFATAMAWFSGVGAARSFKKGVLRNRFGTYRRDTDPFQFWFGIAAAIAFSALSSCAAIIVLGMVFMAFFVA